jgi:DNA-binding MarR family transcriptional regulator
MAEPVRDEFVDIGRQFGIFLRRAERFYAGLRDEPGGLDLDKGAYILLGRLASDGPGRLSALAEDVYLDLSTVSRQVGALEQAGLVARTPDPKDGRAALIAATEAGIAVITRHRERSLAGLRELLADWTPTERHEFARLFTKFNETIEVAGQSTKTTRQAQK